MPEQFVHLVAGMYGYSLLVGFGLPEFLLDCTDLSAFKGFLKYLFDESGYDTTLKSEEFTHVVAEMFQILLCQMIAAQVHRCERRHGVNSPDFGVVMELLQFVGFHA